MKKRYIDLLIDISFGVNEISALSKKSGMNYAHLTRVVNYWVMKGFIQKVTKGNIHLVSFTELGKETVEALKGLKKILESDKHASTNTK